MDGGEKLTEFASISGMTFGRIGMDVVSTPVHLVATPLFRLQQ